MTVVCLIAGVAIGVALCAALDRPLRRITDAIERWGQQ